MNKRSVRSVAVFAGIAFLGYCVGVLHSPVQRFIAKGLEYELVSTTFSYIEDDIHLFNTLKAHPQGTEFAPNVADNLVVKVGLVAELKPSLEMYDFLGNSLSVMCLLKNRPDIFESSQSVELVRLARNFLSSNEVVVQRVMTERRYSGKTCKYGGPIGKPGLSPGSRQ